MTSAPLVKLPCLHTTAGRARSNLARTHVIAHLSTQETIVRVPRALMRQQHTTIHLPIVMALAQKNTAMWLVMSWVSTPRTKGYLQMWAVSNLSALL